MKGEVIGITNAKVSDVGVEGMSYAININSAIVNINELMTEMTAA
jgi:serine protease Do